MHFFNSNNKNEQQENRAPDFIDNTGSSPSVPPPNSTGPEPSARGLADRAKQSGQSLMANGGLRTSIKDKLQEIKAKELSDPHRSTGADSDMADPMGNAEIMGARPPRYDQ